MLLGGAAGLLDKPIAPRRRAMIEALRDRFAERFATIEYELAWHSPPINAQATRRGRQNIVTVYGGLLACSVLRREGLALALAHETGHLLGGAPKAWFMPSLSCECRADHWAGKNGIPMLFGRREGRQILRHGLPQLAALWATVTSVEPSLANQSDFLAFKRRHLLAGFNGHRKPACHCETA